MKSFNLDVVGPGRLLLTDSEMRNGCQLYCGRDLPPMFVCLSEHQVEGGVIFS